MSLKALHCLTLNYIILLFFNLYYFSTSSQTKLNLEIHQWKLSVINTKKYILYIYIYIYIYIYTENYFTINEILEVLLVFVFRFSVFILSYIKVLAILCVFVFFIICLWFIHLFQFQLL